MPFCDFEAYPAEAYCRECQNMVFDSAYPIVCNECSSVVADYDYLDLIQQQKLWIECPNCACDSISLLQRGTIQICHVCKEACTPLQQYKILQKFLGPVYELYLENKIPNDPTIGELMTLLVKEQSSTVVSLIDAAKPDDIYLCCDRYWDDCNCDDPLPWDEVMPHLNNAIVDFAYFADITQWDTAPVPGCSTCVYKATQFCRPFRHWLSKYWYPLDRVIHFDKEHGEVETEVMLYRYDEKRPVGRIDGCANYLQKP